MNIKNIDLLVCHGGYYDATTKSVAVELLKTTHTEAVYGAFEEMTFLPFNKNVPSTLVNIVEKTDRNGGYYKFYYNERNELVRKGGLFAFGVMTRITEKDRVPFNVILDYPNT